MSTTVLDQALPLLIAQKEKAVTRQTTTMITAVAIAITVVVAAEAAAAAVVVTETVVITIIAVTSPLKKIDTKRRIFHEAMLLHEEKYVTDNIDAFERKRMSCGISGILDLTYDSEEGQKKLFGDEV